MSNIDPQDLEHEPDYLALDLKTKRPTASDQAKAKWQKLDEIRTMREGRDEWRLYD